MESNEVFIQCIKYIESSITHHNTPASTDELLLYPTSSPTLHPLSPFLLYRTPSLVAPPLSIFLIYTSSSQSFLSSTFCVYICVAPLGSCIDQGQCVRKEDGSAVNVSSASPSRPGPGGGQTGQPLQAPQTKGPQVCTMYIRIDIHLES